MVILGAPGAPKPDDRVMGPRDMIAETHGRKQSSIGPQTAEILKFEIKKAK